MGEAGVPGACWTPCDRPTIPPGGLPRAWLSLLLPAGTSRSLVRLLWAHLLLPRQSGLFCLVHLENL